MSVKKFAFTMILLLILAGAAFYVGWLGIKIKPGECGVMVSKTSGVYPVPLHPEKFVWRWEPLIPKNANIKIFSLSPYKASQSFTGELPSGALYAKLIGSKDTDFSYSAQISVTLSLPPEEILNAVSANKIDTQEDLNAYYEEKSKVVAECVLNSLLEQNIEIKSLAKSFSTSELNSFCQENKRDFEPFIVVSVDVENAKIPDVSLYNSSKELYQEYKSTLQEELKIKAKEQALTIAEEEKMLLLLEKYALALEKYPQLKDISNISALTSIIKSMQ